MIRDYDNFTREELVAEYIESFLAGVYLYHDGSGLHEDSIPVDMPKDVAFWQSKDKNRRLMHKEIARRYHVKYEDILWLENVGLNDDMYLYKHNLKPCIRDAIRMLEAQEAGIDPRDVEPSYRRNSK